MCNKDPIDECDKDPIGEYRDAINRLDEQLQACQTREQRIQAWYQALTGFLPVAPNYAALAAIFAYRAVELDDEACPRGRKMTITQEKQ